MCIYVCVCYVYTMHTHIYTQKQINAYMAKYGFWKGIGYFLEGDYVSKTQDGFGKNMHTYMYTENHRETHHEVTFFVI